MKHFTLKNDNFDGLFNYIRSFNPTSLFSVKVTSNNFLDRKTGFCKPEYSGGKADSIIDGNLSTCWGNDESESESDQEVIIDLGINKFALSTLVFSAVCGPPSVMQILGSNDNEYFTPICELINFTQRYVLTNHTCGDGETSYRIFKLQQIGQNLNNQYRFHVSEIEFFGVLNQFRVTCKQRNLFINLINLVIYQFIITSGK